jgi:hypothetical protein
VSNRIKASDRKQKYNKKQLRKDLGKENGSENREQGNTTSTVDEEWMRWMMSQFTMR